MFKSMRLKNFKAYKDSGDVPLAPLTVIVGANNSGKSTLFHALLALAQTAQGRDQGWAPSLATEGLVDLGGIHDILHARGTQKSSFFEISVTLDTKTASVGIHAHGHLKNGLNSSIPGRAEIAFGWNDDLGEIAVKRSTFYSGETTVLSVEKKADGWSFLTRPPGAPNDVEVDFQRVFPFVSAPRDMRPDENSPEQVKAERASGFCASYWNDIFRRKIAHIGALRGRVPWHASIGARTLSGFGMGGEDLFADLGSNEKDWTGKTRLELLNEWLSGKGILKQVHLREVGKGTGVRMLLGDDWHGLANINISAMGVGVSQILPIIAYSRYGADDDCLVIEQPEIHLHPALQAELGDLFIDVAQTGHRQILVETHSEHLLLRVRRRIAEGTLKPDQVAILFVEKDGGESKVRRLDLNSRGHFSDWPKGFFDEAYQEAMALAEAASKKGR